MSPVSPCHASAISMSGVPNQSSLTLFLKYWVGNLMFLAGAVSTTRAHANTANGGLSNCWAAGCLWRAIFFRLGYCTVGDVAFIFRFYPSPIQMVSILSCGIWKKALDFLVRGMRPDVLDWVSRLSTCKLLSEQKEHKSNRSIRSYIKSK